MITVVKNRTTKANPHPTYFLQAPFADAKFLGRFLRFTDDLNIQPCSPKQEGAVGTRRYKRCICADLKADDPELDISGSYFWDGEIFKKIL